ncbi:hypothetical protein CHARACLAT_033432, partial [Characodon lateralis]|nr:hypothetical protein [Characodon lateralis]
WKSNSTVELFDFSLGDERVQPRVPRLCFHQRMCDGRIEEILEILLPLRDNVPSRGQQLRRPTVKSVGEALLSLPEAPDGLPESLRGHGLTELLPGQNFCPCHSPGHSTLGLMVSVSCLWSPTSYHRVRGLLQRQAPQTLRPQLWAA